MNAPDKKSGLDLMRAPFPEHQIGKLAKGTKAQTQCQASEKVNCAICGGWHHPKMIHLDYVGHAALTDRLLDCDPSWSWEPLSYVNGLPAFDSDGGLWIKLTVCGVTRLGYGNAADSDYKEIGSRQKEVIGDALRNAAMRFGAALELWHKGDLHLDDKPESTKSDAPKLDHKSVPASEFEKLDPESQKYIRELADEVLSCKSTDEQVQFLANVILEVEEKAALWSLLDSKTRSAIKKASKPVTA